MYFHINITHIAATVLCLASCSRYDAALEEKLQELDALVENSDKYTQAFLVQQDSLKAVHAAATTDSLRWETAFRIVHNYRFFDADSASVWLVKMRADIGTDSRRAFITDACESIILKITGYYPASEALFQSIKLPPCIDYVMEQMYFTAGYILYERMLQNTTEKERYKQLRDDLMKELLRRDATSDYSLGRQGRWYVDTDRLDDAQRVLEKVLSHDISFNRRASREYYLGCMYKKRGDVRNMRYHWAESAICGFKAPEREYHAAYHLAMNLYETGDTQRAIRYLNRTLDDAAESKYLERVTRASQAHLFISEEATKMGRQRRVLMLVSLILLLMLYLSIMLTLLNTRRFSKSLSQANDRLSEANRRLKDANAIKENFLARYMELSSDYIGKVDELRRSLRRTAKEKGVDEMMALLRKASHAHEEYTDFYAAFDEVILKMYPDFIEKVNALLEEGHRQETAADGSLTTELRILALIRLGITDSRKIAGILNVAVSTIYSYRYRLRKWALCPQDNFESEISRIDL